MTADKFFTALAWLIAPLSILVFVIVFAFFPTSQRDYTWAQWCIWSFGIALISSAWLIARYCL